MENKEYKKRIKEIEKKLDKLELFYHNHINRLHKIK